MDSAILGRLVFARSLCLIENGGDLLLLHGAPTKPRYPNRYNGIGGHLEAGEDPLTSARREVREETGLDLPDLTLRAIIRAEQEPGPAVLLFVFTGHSATRETRASTEGDLVWVPRHQLASLDGLMPDLPVLLQQLDTLPPGQLLYGLYTAGVAGDMVTHFCRGRIES